MGIVCRTSYAKVTCVFSLFPLDDADEISDEKSIPDRIPYLSTLKKFVVSLFSTDDEEPELDEYTNEERLDELEDYIGKVAGYARSLAENMDDYLYTDEETPLEELNREIEEFKESYDSNPQFYQFFKRGVDTETLAFYSLSDNAKQRLLN